MSELIFTVVLTEEQRDAIQTALSIASKDAIPYDAAAYASAFEAIRSHAVPTLDVHPFTEDAEGYCVECGNLRDHELHRRNFTLVQETKDS